MADDVKTRMRKIADSFPEQLLTPKTLNQALQWNEPGSSVAIVTIFQAQFDFLADELENLRRQVEG